MFRKITIIGALAALFFSADATNSNNKAVKSFQVCMNDPAGLGSDVVKTAAIPLYDCSDTVRPCCAL